MDENRPSHGSPGDDDFQRAAAAAEAKIGKTDWSIMPPTEQARAIYEHLKAIDAERAASVVIHPARRGRLNAVTKASSVWDHQWVVPASHSDSSASE